MFLLKKNVRVVIKNQNLALELKTGTNLYEALVSEKVIPPSLCRGNGQCGKCKVHITQKNLARPNKKEQLVLAKINLDTGFRLACQTTVREDMTVDTSEIFADRHLFPAHQATIPQPPKAAPEPARVTEAPKPEQPEMAEVSAPITPPEPEEPAAEAPAKTAAPAEKMAMSAEKVATPAEKVADKLKDIKKTDQNVDGLLLVQNKNQIRYFLYSAAIDTIAQEGLAECSESLSSYIDNGTLMDYIHDQLKIKDIDRLIVLMDEPTSAGENIFDIISYQPFDIGPLPCEIIRPLPSTGDLSLFFRLLSSKSKKRLLISLDKLDHSYYMTGDKLIQLPFGNGIATNLFEISAPGDNPIVSVSDDLKTLTTQREFYAPDSILLPVLIRAAALMVKHKLATPALHINGRDELDSAVVPLEYIVKVMRSGDSNSFYLLRKKEGDIVITQDMLTALAKARDYIKFIIEYTETTLGSVENIVICTPATQPTLLDSMIDLDMLPKKYHGCTTHSPGDSAVMASKLFQEPDVRSYIHKNYGGFIRPE